MVIHVDSGCLLRKAGTRATFVSGLARAMEVSSHSISRFVIIGIPSQQNPKGPAGPKILAPWRKIKAVA